jgi:hypothetical protein
LIFIAKSGIEGNENQKQKSRVGQATTAAQSALVVVDAEEREMSGETSIHLEDLRSLIEAVRNSDTDRHFPAPDEVIDRREDRDRNQSAVGASMCFAARRADRGVEAA